MDQITLVNLSILIILWGMQLKLRPFLVKNQKKISLTILAVIVGTTCIKALRLFLAWQSSEPPLKYLAPPYAPISYFLHTAWTQIFSQYVIALSVGIIIFGLIKLLPKAKQEAIFESEEPIVITLCILLMGHPLWIAYLCFSLLCYALITITKSTAQKERRVSFYHYWTPLAILTLILGNHILKISILAQLRLYGG